jgi:hypothetical protein
MGSYNTSSSLSVLIFRYVHEKLAYLEEFLEIVFWICSILDIMIWLDSEYADPPISKWDASPVSN